MVSLSFLPLFEAVVKTTPVSLSPELSLYVRDLPLSSLSTRESAWRVLFREATRLSSDEDDEPGSDPDDPEPEEESDPEPEADEDDPEPESDEAPEPEAAPEDPEEDEPEEALEEELEDPVSESEGSDSDGLPEEDVSAPGS